MTNTFTIGLLATAVSASLAMANGGEEEKNKFQDKSPVSFKAGSGVTFDGGDDFSLTLKNRLQVQYVETFGDDVEDTQNFDIRRARTSLSGHVYNKNIHYNLMMDWTDNDSAIRDAWTQWNFAHGDGSTVGLRAGQGKPGHGLEFTGTSAGLYFVERSIATEFFANSRARGAWLQGNHAESKFRWMAGVQNNGVSDAVDGSDDGDNDDNELVYVASANFDPMGDYVGGGKTYESWMQGDLEGAKELKGTIGAGVAIDNRGSDNNAFGLENESTQFNLNTAWSVSNFWVMVDYYNRTDDIVGGDSLDHDGFSGTVGYTLPKNGDSAMQWGLGVRYSEFTLDETILDDSVTQFGLVLNAFYHGHKCKTQVEFNNLDDGTDTAQQILVQFQIII